MFYLLRQWRRDSDLLARNLLTAGFGTVMVGVGA